MDFYWIIFGAFVLLSFLFLTLAFQLKKRKNFYSSFLSSLCLISASLTLSVGGLEIVSIVYYKYIQSQRPSLPVPKPFIRHRAPFLRVQDSILFLSPPNREFRTFGHSYTTSNLGFRERNFPFKKPPETFRILVFGDSLTFGVGLADHQRYTNILEEMLSLQFPDQHFEVLNFGVPGFATDQERDLMEAILKQAEGDLVVVGFCCDDIKMTTQSYLKHFVMRVQESGQTFEMILNLDMFKNPRRTYEKIPAEPLKEFQPASHWYQETQLYQALDEHTNFFIDHALPTPAQWNYVLNEFMAMMDLTNQYQLPPPVVVLLNLGFVDPNKNDFNHPRGNLAQFIRKLDFVGEQLGPLGFTIVDTLPLFQKYSHRAMAISEWEWHPNYLANYLYAQSIFDTLVGQGVIH